MKSDISIGIIGAGAMGTALGLGLSSAGYDVSVIASRTERSAFRLIKRIPGSRYPSGSGECFQSCDLIFITTPDDLISEVAAKFSWKKGQSVIHCSGARGLSVLDSARAQGALVGAFHPFQTFSNVTSSKEAIGKFVDIYFVIEAHGRLLNVLQEIATKLGGKVLCVENKHRALYHSSAVLSCGYIVTLLYSAVQLWKEIGFSEEEALDAIGTMAYSTVQSVRRYGLVSTVTGPVVRGDTTTLNHQLRALSINDTGFLKLFIALTEASLPMLKGFLSEDKQREILKLVMRYGDAGKSDNLIGGCSVV
ncbi:MAG: hypothetical protein CL891_03285 [Dehalococcoidia bacterium]|nr:hypothetical protein [Dehalococcoidia bacterium]